MGGLIVERWTSVLANLVASFETRVVYDILSDRRDNGLFYMAVSGNKLDNFDVLYDPTAQDQILAGKLTNRDAHTYFDTWTSFLARPFRSAAARERPRHRTARTTDGTIFASRPALRRISRCRP